MTKNPHLEPLAAIATRELVLAAIKQEPRRMYFDDALTHFARLYAKAYPLVEAAIAKAWDDKK